jgi:6-phosphogluconolactonase (cycloisomerase 2 family)
MHSRQLALTIFLCFFGLCSVASAQSTFVYTANTLAGQSGAISVYKLNTTTGALSPSGAQFPDDAPNYLASTASGKFLVVSRVNCPTCGLETLSINPTTGTLTFSHSYEQIGTVLFKGGQIASDAAGRTIYAQGALQSTGVIEGVIDALHVNADGSLTQIGTAFAIPEVFALQGQGPLAVDPKGRWVFAIIADANDNQILISIPRNTDGSLGTTDSSVSLPDQKCNTNTSLPLIAIDPQGKNLFIACGAPTFIGIQVYGINQTTGTPSRVNSFLTQHFFEALVVDRQGWRVFADTQESNLVEPFDFNRNVDKIGLLNGGTLYHIGALANGVAVDPANKFVYVTNGSFCTPQEVAEASCVPSDSNNINGFSFNYVKGTLTALPGSPFASGAGTRSMVFVKVP